jgi:hypothetical protein
MKIIINENQNFVLRRLSYVDEIMDTKFEWIYHNTAMKRTCDDYVDEYKFFNVVCEYIYEMFYLKYLTDFGDGSNEDMKILESYYDLINAYINEKYGSLIKDRYSDNCP